MGCATVNNKGELAVTVEDVKELWDYHNALKRRIIEDENKLSSLWALVDQIRGQLTILSERSQMAKYEVHNNE